MRQLEYFHSEFENGYVFDDPNWEIARKMYKTAKEFNNLMVEKFNAKIPNSIIVNEDPVFPTEEDIKAALEFINPHIEGYWVMFALTRNNNNM